jgi:hypothetical protein
MLDRRHTLHLHGIPVSHPEMKPPAIAKTSLGVMAISKPCGMAVPVPDRTLSIVW